MSQGNAPDELSLRTGLERPDAEQSVLVVRCEDIEPAFETWNLLLSDIHFDSTHCDRSLLQRHLQQAKERNARIFLFGDTFDAMQGKEDKRGSLGQVRSELKRDDYFDALVEKAVTFFAPYKDNIALISEGNHEWAVEKHYGTNLVTRFANQLGIHAFGEWGFVVWMFSRSHNGGRTRRKMFFHHINTGGSVTKGVIGANRRETYVQDADLLVTGHIHEMWQVESPFIYCTQSNRVEIRQRTHLQLGTYKQEWGHKGFHMRGARPPKPLGGWWLRFYWDNRMFGKVAFETIRTD